MPRPIGIYGDQTGSRDPVRGSRAKGDDDPTKPFATVELIAGLEALLRRSAESRDTVLQVAPLELDLMERTTKRADRAIDLGGVQHT